MIICIFLREIGLSQNVDQLLDARMQSLIGIYWSLRAAFGPLLETLISLDRLLFLQEQGDVLESVMLPIFNPAISPRNVAIIAKKPDAGISSHHSSREGNNFFA